MSDLKTASPLISSARTVKDTLVARLSGEIDLNNSPELRSALLDLYARASSKRVVLNLGAVPYMDSSAIAVLVELLRKVIAGGGKVILTDLQPRVKGLLEIARLNSIFGILPTEEQALA